MRPSDFSTITQLIRTDLTGEQCVVVEKAAHDVGASRAAEALIGERAMLLDGTRRCPHCATENTLIRHGRDARGLQRFLCARGHGGCGRTSNALTGTVLANMHKPDCWLPYAKTMMEGKSLTKAAEEVGISRTTSFRWRHLLLPTLSGLSSSVLGGIVEADETFFLHSYKGSRDWKRGAAPEPRMPRYRGGVAPLPGLSKFHSPVLTALDRQGHTTQAVLPELNHENILAVLEGKIEPESVLCSDGYAAYPKAADKAHSEHRDIRLPKPDWLDKAKGDKPRRPGVLTLGRVSEYHAALKTFLNRTLHGVSTKYLGNYLHWTKLLRSNKEPLDILKAAIA